MTSTTSAWVVVAAHGSRAEAANAAHCDVVAALDAAIEATARPAFLELTGPSIPDVIDQAVADGATEVLVLPYFLHPGRHTGEDMPAIVSAAIDRHPTVEVRLLDLFGADPALVQVLVSQARVALEGRNPA